MRARPAVRVPPRPARSPIKPAASPSATPREAPPPTSSQASADKAATAPRNPFGANNPFAATGASRAPKSKLPQGQGAIFGGTSGAGPSSAFNDRHPATTDSSPAAELRRSTRSSPPAAAPPAAAPTAPAGRWHQGKAPVGGGLQALADTTTQPHTRHTPKVAAHGGGAAAAAKKRKAGSAPSGGAAKKGGMDAFVSKG